PPILSEGTFAFATAFTAAGTSEIIQTISFAYFEVSSESQGCLSGMKRIPAGTFTMGDNSGVGYIDEYPLHSVYVDSYCIDIYEYPNVVGQLPDEGVSWVEAESMCTQQGKRLCSEAEWEKACKGPLGTIFTYNDYYDGVKCWTEAGYNEGEPGASGARSRCRNEYGVFDMSGNVWEWVSDFYGADYYGSSPTENPTGPVVGSSKVIRGGAWFHGSLATRCSFRAAYDLERGRFGSGVRCCSD
ncbi:MAG: SUMF1/EgtB/PvdO family nonheme iron enzyme, partial [Candidatus Coatesbacteria bacterium]|nr:SUMF1/EgtB/PvdO family nonheme iron enzyme [Candidatus Coatesbacteria bacterium]